MIPLRAVRIVALFLVFGLLSNPGMALIAASRARSMSYGLFSSQALSPRPPGFPALFLSGSQNVSAAIDRAATHFGNPESYSEASPDAIDEGHKQLVRSLMGSSRTIKALWHQGTLIWEPAHFMTETQQRLLAKLNMALRKSGRNGPATFYLFDGDEKVKTLPDLGRDPRELVRLGKAVVYAEAGAGGQASIAPTPSVYLTQQFLRDVSSSGLDAILPEELDHAAEKAAGNRQAESWDPDKLRVLLRVKEDLRSAPRLRDDLQTLLLNMIPGVTAPEVEALLAQTDYDMLHAVSVRRLNLQFLPHRAMAAQKWREESPYAALEFLATGIRSRGRGSHGNAYYLKDPPKDISVPASLKGKKIFTVGHGDRTEFWIEWLYLPDEKVCVPVAVTGDDDPKDEVTLLRTFVSGNKRDNWTVERVGVHSTRKITRGLYNTFGNYRVYGRASTVGGITLAHVMRTQNDDIAGAGVYSLPGYADELYIADVRDDGVPVSFDFPARSAIETVHRVIRMDAKGRMLQVVESVLRISGTRLRVLAEALEPYLMRESSTLWVTDLLTTHGGRSGNVLLSIGGLLDAVGNIGENRIRLPNAAYRKSPARLRVGQNGIADFLHVWSPIMRDYQRFLKRVEVRFADGRRRVLRAFQIASLIRRLSPDAVTAHQGGGQLVITELKLRRQSQHGLGLTTGGQVITMSVEWTQAIGQYRDAEVFYDPSSSTPLPIQLVVGEFSSHSPWDAHRHFIPHFILPLKPFGGETKTYVTTGVQEVNNRPSPVREATSLDQSA